MKPSWLIQTNMDDIDTESIMAEVTSQGMIVLPVKYQVGRHVKLSQYSPNDCIICYGYIDFVRQIHKRLTAIPGAWCNFHNMKCSTYYAYFGEHLLNKQYIMKPLGDIARSWDELVICAPDQSWFIRPDSGAKPFVGHTIGPNEKHKIQSLIKTVGPEMLVVIAPHKSIGREWRFVICDRKVVAGCRYLPDESPDYSSIELQPSSFRLAAIIAEADWQPDLCYTVDIAESDNEVYLLEINSFSSSGFYDCDIESIVRCASATAIQEWQGYNAP